MYTTYDRIDRLDRHFFDFPHFFSWCNFKIPLRAKSLRDTHIFLHQLRETRTKMLEPCTSRWESAFLIPWCHPENEGFVNGLLQDAIFLVIRRQNCPYHDCGAQFFEKTIDQAEDHSKFDTCKETKQSARTEGRGQLYFYVWDRLKNFTSIFYFMFI